MSGAWGKPLAVREQTQEEKQEAAQRAAAAKADEASKALMRRATELVDKIEACTASRSAGVSAKYGSDEQYGVAGTWAQAEASQAFIMWKARYGTSATALDMHMLGPSKKYSGGRNGKSQINFIRKIVAGKGNRFNIHVDWNGT